MWASFPNYGDQSNAVGPFCANVPDSMPPGRQTPCGQPVLTHADTGVYGIRVANGAPLPLVGTRVPGNDSGYAIFVVAVGSNAICSENSMQVIGNDLISWIYCLTPSGSPVDTSFSWFYRTDSSSYPQANAHPFNLIYARVNATNPSQLVDSESFNPFAESMSSQRLARGQYRVTFNNVNPQSSNLDIEASTGMNNVIVQRSCTNDSSTTCARSVCIPSTWSNGTGGAGSNLTIDVRCFSGSQALDVDFRVLVANEAHTSQAFASGGIQYGWANSVALTGTQCKTTTQFKHRNQHQSPESSWPTLPMQVCRRSTGTYRVTFTDQSLYHNDTVAALVSSRATNGTYCNVSRIDCGNLSCSATPPPFIDVKCYTASGSAVDALWNLSIVY